MCAGRRMFPGFYAGFLCLSQAKHMRKKAMPYNEVNGVANPTMAREVPGSRDIRMDSGMRMQKAEVMPWIMTGMLMPRPLR